jgi:hypothetical protein
MSICRWSSMNFTCDLYCYESEHSGYVTHVANQRVIGNVPKVDYTLFTLENNTPENTDKFFEQYKAQMAFISTAERKPIGLKYDGQTFYDDKESLLSRLSMLREEGYKFPEITEEDLE